jgi:hypothetical protein
MHSLIPFTTISECRKIPAKINFKMKRSETGDGLHHIGLIMVKARKL